jgi:teichuronic acid biosynthesis glycosyltransferase TuaH
VSGNTDNRVVFISHTHAGGIFKVGSHHLARELSIRGYNVAHVSTPFSTAHAALGKGADGRKEQSLLGAQRDEHGVLQLVPRTILPARLSTSRYLRNALQDTEFFGARFMLVDQPLMSAGPLTRFAKTVIYRPTDLYLAGAAAAKQRALLKLAAGVIATSDEVLHALPLDRQIPRMTIENGVEFSRFAAPRAEHRSGAVYVGALDERFDWDAIRQFALAVPDAPVRLAGPADSAPTDLPSNVELLGSVPYSDVPALLARARVGLLPLSDSPSNRGRSPMKLFEYLAAGLRVVSRETPVIAARNLPGVFTYQRAEQGAALYSVEHLHTDPNLTGIEAARRQDWAAKADEVEKFLLAL